MSLTDAQRADRLRKRIEELKLWTVKEYRTIDGWTFGGAPLALGAPWPTRDGVVTLARDGIEVPDEWPLEESRLELDLGGEGLLRIDYASGSQEGFGLDPNHRLFPLQGRRLSVRAECVARLPFGVPNRSAALVRAAVVRLDVPLAQLELLLTQVAETAEVIAGHDAVAAMLDAAEAALGLLVWPTATAAYLARIAPGAEAQRIWQLPDDLDPMPAGLGAEGAAGVIAATEALRAELRALRDRYPPDGALALTGHAHIDLAWLWPLEETRRKANRTFHTMIGLMERNPEFRFNQSTAQLYAYLEEDDPSLFAAIREKAAAGNWEPIGAMWVEPDTNMPTGESFVRQLLYGQRYFERVFGRRHDVCWLPDCFGFSPALPQLLRQAGVTSFFTIKVNWSETNAMPYDLFWWEGLDGSRVLSHTFRNPVGGYNAETGPTAVMETWRNYRGKHRSPESLLSFGFGDGGGGPTQEMLDRQRQMDDFPVLPKLRPVSVAEWFADLHARVGEDAAVPVWVGEMYLELHRGTLTTQGRTKFLHRRAERALIAAETLSSLAALAGGPVAESLEPQWQVVLRNEFHDILPGSSIREVYKHAEAELASVVAEGTRISNDRIEALAAKIVPAGSTPGVLVVNPDLSTRPLRLKSDGQLPDGQTVEGGSVLSGTADVPGLSAAVVTGTTARPGLSAGPGFLENDLVRVEVAGDGTLASLWDKTARRETLAGRGNQIWAYVDKPRNWDAWDIEDTWPAQGEEITASEIEVVETGPHRAALRIVRTFRDSRIVQSLRLWANSPRVDFATEIEWHERRLLLKARFPLAIRSSRATFECAHGVIERPTHKNTSWDTARFEVAAHRFVDLSEHGYGVALVNDGKYGHHAFGSELGLSLLRSPVFPDPLADEGWQAFTYSLYPHAGDWLSGGVLAEAEDLNQPLFAKPVETDGTHVWTPIRVEGMPLGLSAFKPAEDGSGLILRAYEPVGGRGAVTLALPEGWRSRGGVNLMEEPDGDDGDAILPFEVRSWAIEPE